MKTIVVTGGAGFLGSHLCDYLIKKGNKVICIDNLFTGDKKNIHHLIDHENFTFLNHDIIESIELDHLMTDQIYNLACPASPIHYQINPVRTIKANTMGVINVLGLAKKHKARILQASTSEIYGDPLEHPQTESYRGNVNTIGPRACYDEGKRVAETLFFDYHRQHALEIRVMRIFNTYGPRMAEHDGRVVSNFILQALRDEPITIYGDGTQLRDYIYVCDVVDALLSMGCHPNAVGEIFNIGYGQSISLVEAAQIIVSLSESGRVTHIPWPNMDKSVETGDFRCDISHARQTLGWKPLYDWQTGFTESVDTYRRILS